MYRRRRRGALVGAALVLFLAHAAFAGEQLTEHQLLEALLIPSSNNVARILATAVAGGEARFIAEMNAEARALGMDHTIYTDPSGLDPSTVSTAADQLRVFERVGCLAFFTHVTVGGHGLTAVGVVMGQGQGSDTQVLLAAAGEAATQLVESIVPAVGMSTPATPSAAGGPGLDAVGHRRPLPPAPGPPSAQP